MHNTIKQTVTLLIAAVAIAASTSPRYTARYWPMRLRLAPPSPAERRRHDTRGTFTGTSTQGGMRSPRGGFSLFPFPGTCAHRSLKRTDMDSCRQKISGRSPAANG